MADEPAEVLGPAQPALQARARDFELVPARRSNSLTVDRSRYRLARRREGVQVDSTVAVNRHYDVAGSELDVHEIEASGLKQRRGDALYVI